MRAGSPQTGGPALRPSLPFMGALTGLSPEGFTSPGTSRPWTPGTATVTTSGLAMQQCLLRPPLLLASLASHRDMVASSSSRLTLACVLRAPAPGGHCGQGLCPCFPGQELPTGSLFPSRESNSCCCHGSSKSSPAGKSPVF